MENQPVKSKRAPTRLKTIVPLPGNTKVTIYAGRKVAEAFKTVSYDMDMYRGVRLAQLLEALYEQGKQDGARDVFERLDDLKGEVKHRLPGQPRKKKKPSKKK